MAASPRPGAAARGSRIDAAAVLRAVSLSGAILLAGCSTLLGVSGGPAPDIFDLSTPAAFEGTRTAIRAQLLVPQPTALDALSSNRIAVRPDEIRIAYFPRGVWSDQLPSLVQLKLVRSFENSGKAKAVGRPGESLAIDYQVLVDLRAFEIDVPSGGAHVEFGVKLLDDRTGRVRATRIVSARAPGGTGDVAGAVSALDVAADQAMREVVDWTAGVL